MNTRVGEGSCVAGRGSHSTVSFYAEHYIYTALSSWKLELFLSSQPKLNNQNI